MPAIMLRPAGGPVKLASASASPGSGTATAAYEVKAPATGTRYVQLGAFDSATVAKDAWNRASRRFAMLAGHSPNGMTFKANGEDVYRLSVGGFSRSSADTLCRQYRAKGGACFIRQGAGDVMAQWLRKPECRWRRWRRGKGGCSSHRFDQHHPGAGRGPIGKRCQLSAAFRHSGLANWAPASAGVVPCWL
ncbi:SPOR domain-containing protein [Sphingomonas faeni]|uniref:SPOR domain-containing protein n=1 Tax=Sphingomonas faeni TaxID=185950 RepID=UPI00277D74AF|nr:SPOR domain-containing protein [Sphingomonas faeni]MDQ0837719.1 hypothetical protein [Sphingomonas faeni]